MRRVSSDMRLMSSEPWPAGAQVDVVATWTPRSTFRITGAKIDPSTFGLGRGSLALDDEVSIERRNRGRRACQ